MSSCFRVPVACLHILQSAEGEEPSLCSLSWVLRRLWSIFHKKEAMSGGMPCCLHRDQDRVQSVLGLASSALQDLNTLVLVSWSSSMVINSSVRSMVQSLSVMVVMSRACLLFKSLISLKKSLEKYGGSWFGAPGTSSSLRICFLYS